jgi:hypothetical protein
MAKFKIAVEWVTADEIIVEANSLEEAMAIAMDSDEMPEGYYVDGSFQINYEVTRMMNLGQIN